MVTRGPGATHAAGGVHTAYQDSTPMILLIGQVGRGMTGREAFQEIDYTHMFGPMAKWVAQIDSADRVPELMARAFHVATAGRPGPVVLALPEDMLVEQSQAADAETVRTDAGAPVSGRRGAGTPHARGRRTPSRDRRRRTMERGGPRRADRLVRRRRRTRRGGMALPGLRRQHVGGLRGSPCTRARSKARAADA